MFEYAICNQPDQNIFQRQCAALEKRIPEIHKGKLLKDVDGSQTQLYSIDGKQVEVHHSYYIGAVYVTSEIDLTPYFH
ncbi:MAG: hypothetical protein E7511_03090 [Ruminococcus sp.]|nr:hypothetical protein [Ruminococcus sp.]